MNTPPDFDRETGGEHLEPGGRRLTAEPRNEGVDAAVAAARRVITSLLHAGDGSAAEMTRIAERLTAVADHLDEHVKPVEERIIDMWSGEGIPRHDPVTGPENAIAPPLVLHGQGDGTVEGSVVLGIAYQGPPGYVHGGVSALLLDHALGVANGWAGHAGVTGELSLRYRRPLPLFETLTVRARQLTVDGRKIRTSGTISYGGEECVVANGLFITSPLHRPA